MADREMAREVLLTKADYEALAGLRYMLRRFMSFSTFAAEAAGLPPR